MYRLAFATCGVPLLWLSACGARTSLDVDVEDHPESGFELDGGSSVDGSLDAADEADGSPIRVVQLSAGSGHTCALLSSGAIRCWGLNDSGELGDGTTIPHNAPVDVVSLGGSAIYISAYIGYTCAVLSLGTIRCWGLGLINDGVQPFSPTPVDVPLIGGTATTVSAGSAHACVLLSSGAVRCWGSNRYGSLGNGSGSRTAPVDDVSLGGIAISISAGGGHSCAVLSTGSTKCWGLNAAGQLGDGTNSDNRLPTDVIGLGGSATAVTAGDTHTCASLVGGRAQCWGFNRWGELANGATANSSSPVDTLFFGGPTDSIVAHFNDTCAILTIGNIVKCVGRRGDPDNTAFKVTPDSNSLGGTAKSIVFGTEHGCALLTSGVVRCWGSNTWGELGDGTNAPSAGPVTVQNLPH